MRTSRNLTTEKTCAPMDLHAKVCFTTFRLEVRKYCFTCAVADGLMQENDGPFVDEEGNAINYFVNRSTNASAESLNAKIKHFRAQLRGIIDRKFFLFTLMKIYA